ncbi:MAG: hypothetical protein Satyrvirus2_61 [Satyrvirus sp.]|uniref:Uncharacterized protein n=1 Tax=Satyrvirus sp. TaxID=2487771 RepID=A0A3G5ACZ5_9VIRU|nr:MAG: hypothetical protein Satyrvirus2_61 [Satyrvirus sp.]
MDKFIKLGDIMFNPKYIKCICCDSVKCKIFVANTAAVSTGHSNTEYLYDDVYTFLANTAEYKILYDIFHKN